MTIVINIIMIIQEGDSQNVHPLLAKDGGTYDISRIFESTQQSKITIYILLKICQQ